MRIEATDVGTTPPHPLKRWLRWTAYGAIACVAYLVLLFAEENWRGERAWQSFRRDLNARGHLLEPIASNEPRLADEQNFLKAPMVSSWFDPDLLSIGGVPPRLIQITRPGDAELMGSWAEVKPANLQEWRQFFHRPVGATNVLQADTDSSPESEAAEVVPLMVIDDLPLVDVIRNLSRQAGLKVRFNPRTLGTADPAHISIRFENVTARNALDAVLDNYGLMLLPNPRTGALDIAAALPQPSGWPHDVIDLAADPLPAGADEVLQSVTMEGIPGADAVRNAVRQVGLNIQFDVGVDAGIQQKNYSLSMSNVTPRQVLAKVLTDHGLALMGSPHDPIYRVFRYRTITRRQQDNTAVGVLESLAGFDEEFRALYAASERPGCQPEQPVRRKYTDWKTAPNFLGYRQVSEALALHASAHLALGNSDAALRDATVLARMVEALRNRSELVGAMIRVVISARYQQVVWEGLAARRWSAEQLNKLARQMESVDLLSGCEMALQSEQVGLSDWMEQTPRGQMANEMLMFSRGPPLSGSMSVTDLPMQLFVLTCPRGWIRQNQLRAVQRFENHFSLLDASRQRFYPEREPNLMAATITSWWDLNPYDYLARTVMPFYTRAVEHTARHQNGLNMARVACALERYRLIHGQFPEALADLTPQFMDSLPNDVTTGLPLNYRKTPDKQFVLHSAGWLRKDFGNESSVITRVSRDWIWRYPAK